MTPAGNESVKPRPVSATAPAATLAMVMVSVEVPLGAIDVCEKLLLTVTPAAGVTVRVALVGALFVMPCVLVNAPAAMVLT